MDKYSIVRKIEEFAPLETQEPWDCSGWLIETLNSEIKKIMLALTITDEVVEQAREMNCDMIISHHPLFYIPIKWSDIDMYCAHTNIDLANGGTTDTLINELGLEPILGDGFVRYVDKSLGFEEFIKQLRKISPNLRYVNKNSLEKVEKIAFCAGSGSEFIKEAYDNGANVFVTGDLKFHTAVESPIAVVDIGHFESEILILRVFEGLVGRDVEILFAKEKSPFIY